MTANHQLLYRITELMLYHEQHVLPVDLLFDDDEIGDFVKSIQIDSPYQQMLLEGVLTESVREEKLYVSFTVEGYFHYVLGAVILSKYGSRDASDWVELSQKNKLRGLREGITQSLIREVQAGNYVLTLALVDEDDTLADACIQPIVIAFTSGSVKQIIDLLLSNRSDSDLRLLVEVIEHLNQANRESVVREVLQYLQVMLETVGFDSNNFHDLKLRILSLMISTDNQIDSITDLLLQSHQRVFQEISANERNDLLVGFYNLLVNKGLISKSVEFAEQFDLYVLEAHWIVNHYCNFIYPLLELGRFEQAEGLFKRLDIEKGDDGFLLNWSGFIYQSWYELKSEDELHLAKGLELYEKSTLLIDKAYGRYSLRKYENLENLGYTYGLMGDANRGLQYLDQAIEIVGKSYRTYTTYKLGNLYEMKAQCLLNANRLNEAIESIDKSDRCKLLQVAANSSEMSWNYETRAQIMLAADNRRDAKIFMKRALDIRSAELGDDNDVTIETKIAYDAIVLE